MENRTEITWFILMRLNDDPDQQLPLFTIFLLIYIITLVWNLMLVLLIPLNSQLHTPMYIFLSNLSLVDFCYSSTITPKVMAGFLTGDKVMSYNSCASQVFFFANFANVENYLLASVNYECYAAVYKPLHYDTTMKTCACACLVISCYSCGFLNVSIYTVNALSLTFCKLNVIHHFFCDIPAAMIVSCSHIHVNDLVLMFVASFNIFFALILILISYTFIFTNIQKMHSNSEYRKALSTCASHFTAVSIFYGTIIFMYLQPRFHHSMDTDKIASVFYTMVIPMLNPLVYSLRNKDVRKAFTKIVLKSR
ncbi:olfactory receptor 5B3-like [Arvicanthis niloticus]|uniref:olfactory receptor 5B3-like n=1 Tax=Arvicanthis niloticus TaxID=61156 RepID=UPI001485D3CC|nr:olfactory receptor 5B3-like [Arvicanthis niloticus]